MMIRTARPEEASAVAVLAYSSAVADHDYVFAMGGKKAEDFLAFACAGDSGIWAHSNAIVVDVNGVIAATIASYPRDRLVGILISGFVLMFKFYGFKLGLKVVWRSLELGLRYRPIPRDGIYVANLGTNPDYRGRGYATNLYEYVHDHWRAKGIKYAVCDVSDDNEASKRILDKVGYVPVPPIDPKAPRTTHRMIRAL